MDLDTTTVAQNGYRCGICHGESARMTRYGRYFICDNCLPEAEKH